MFINPDISECAQCFVDFGFFGLFLIVVNWHIKKGIVNISNIYDGLQLF